MSTPEKNSTKVTKKQAEITAVVLNKVQAFEADGSIQLPKNFSAPNALKSAYIVLSETKTKDGKPVLEACSQTSIAQSLLKSITYGLSVAKGQCYFVPFGTELQCMVSYQGEIANAKRMGDVKEVNASCIMEGDKFEFKTDVNTGRKHVTVHEQTLDSIDNEKILGAYCVVVMNDGSTQADIMSWKSIQTSWAQGSNSPAKSKFAPEMAKRTVIRRALKNIIRSSDDSYLENDPDLDETKSFVDHKIETEANGEVLDINHEEVVDKPKEIEPKPIPKEEVKLKQPETKKEAEKEPERLF